MVHPAQPPLHLSVISVFLCPWPSWNPDGALSGALELPGSCMKGFMKTQIFETLLLFLHEMLCCFYHFGAQNGDRGKFVLWFSGGD